MICDVNLQIHISVLFSVMLGRFAIGRSGSAPKQDQHEGVFLFLLMGTMTMMASGDAVNPREKPWGTSQTLEFACRLPCATLCVCVCACHSDEIVLSFFGKFTEHLIHI